MTLAFAPSTENVTEERSARSVAGSVMHEIDPDTQVGKILLHLLRVGPITQLVAGELYRVHRLASRINDLKNLGVTVTSRSLVDATGVRYQEYSLN